MAKNILFSIGVTCVISTLFGLLFTSKFLIAFSLAFIIQLAFFYFFNTVYTNKVLLRAMELKNNELKTLSKSQATVICPCNERSAQSVDLSVSEDTIYKCEKCDKNVKAEINVKTVLTTDPIYFNDRPRTEN